MDLTKYLGTVIGVGGSYLDGSCAGTEIVFHIRPIIDTAGPDNRDALRKQFSELLYMSQCDGLERPTSHARQPGNSQVP